MIVEGLGNMMGILIRFHIGASQRLQEEERDEEDGGRWREMEGNGGRYKCRCMSSI